jgi:para-nitrobenzyl esterase
MSTLADTAISALEPHEANDASERFLSRLGVTKANADKLQQVTQEEILAALTGGGAAGGQSGNAGPAADLSLRIVPVKDGRTLTVHPFEPVASPLAEGIPLMCGANETEGIPYANPDDPFWKSEITTEAALKTRVKEIASVDDAGADRLIALYRKNRPNYGPQDLALAIAGENTPLRTSATTIAERKFAQGKAPVYMYFFRWRSPIKNGKLRSMHTMELPFVFNHPENTPFMTGTGPEQRKLADQMSAAWAAFARSGKPDAKGLAWPEFDPTKRATMVFNTESGVVNDPFGEERRTMQALRERPRR